MIKNNKKFKKKKNTKLAKKERKKSMSLILAQNER